LTDFFGLDIGSYSIKLVKAAKKGKQFSLVNYGEVKTPVALNSESLTDQQALVEAVKKCCQEAGVKTRKVNASLKENQAYSQIIKFPTLSTNELGNAIRFEAEQFVPVPLEEVQLEYVILRQPPKGSLVEKMEILVVAAQKKAIKRLTDILDKAHLTPISLETEMLATIRLYGLDKDSSDLLISIGQESCDVALVHKGTLKFIHALSVSGSAFTRALANQLSMDFNQAEQYKITYGLDRNFLEGKVMSVLQPVVDSLVDELQKVLVFISQNYKEVTLKRLIMTGGSSNLRSLSLYLASKINLETMIADPFGMFVKDANFPKALLTNPSRFTTVVGLSLKDFY
jgi:type IV pilus assembly protein PilM